MIRNIKIISAVVLAIFIALTIRLAYIQIIGHEQLAAATRAQSLITLEGSNTRGIIYDRHGAALVADKKNYVYIIKESEFDSNATRLLQKVDARQVSSDNDGYCVYSSQGYDKEIGHRLIKDCNAYILQAAARYNENQTAAHLIGYVNKMDSSGAAGLELMYDEELSGLNRKVYAVADVKGNILPGRGLLIASDDEKDSYVKDGIRTTIDKDLQLKVEETIDAKKTVEGKNCAVVVLDCQGGGVVAMACTPDFDPTKAEVYLDSDGSELINKATQGEYPPGSIFKIIVTAAALEAGVPENKTYNCSGHVDMDGITIACDTGGDEGHGLIDMDDAFALSCNSYFIQLGREIGDDTIIKTAQAMCLGKPQLAGFPQESAGHLMTAGESMGNGIGNLSIGQGETLVTPLQMAAATNIIACVGMDKGVHILMDEEVEERQVISANTAGVVAKMMKKTSEEGTGIIVKSPETGKARAAVKTGTAEYMTGDEDRSHGWMTGFAPCENPEYVITVLVEDGGSGAASAGPIFENILRYIEESGSYSQPTLT